MARRVTDGLSFAPTDTEATYGSGPAVEGSGEALVLGPWWSWHLRWTLGRWRRHPAESSQQL